MTYNSGTVAFSKLAHDLLDSCHAGSASEQLLSQLIDGALADDPNHSMAASHALFGTVAEGLSDAFEPRLCDEYTRLFSRVIASGIDELAEGDLSDRYQRVRQPRRHDDVPTDVRKVFVLSRVTLGADVAITSAVLDATKRRFPDAQVVFVGPDKNWELFAADSDLEHARVEYPKRADLRGRLSIWPALRAVLSQSDAIVVDPDSRLTQLGLLPVCDEDRYFFFESRAYGGEGDESLYVLVRRWLQETFGVPAKPYILPVATARIDDASFRTASLGVGKNPRKRIEDPFEEQLLRALSSREVPLFVDVGAGGEERRRVETAVSRVVGPARDVRTWTGSFASFASLISQSGLYAGYDSAGQHVAAVCRVPLLAVFAGFPSPRMFSRWRTMGDGRMEIVRVVDANPDHVWPDVARALTRLMT